MPTLRFPLVGSLTSRNPNPEDFAGKDQLFTNCYPAMAGDKRFVLCKRPGYAVGSALTGVASALTNGAIVLWSGHTDAAPPVASAFLNTGGTSTSVWNLVNSSKIGGDIASTNECTCLTETTVSGTANLVGNFIDSGTGAVEQWYFPQGGAWTQVTDSDFSGYSLVGFPVHMDGWTFNMTADAKIINSDLNSVSSYSAANYITANLYPDKGVTVARLGRLIVGFGEKSTEFFENKGNTTGSPLRHVGGIQLGAARRQADSTQTVLQAQGTIYWVATNSEGASIGVYRFNGTEPEKVSKEHIDRLCADGSIQGFVGTLRLHGMTHIVLEGTSGLWAFCVETNAWWSVVLAAGQITGCLGVGTSSTGPSGMSYFVCTDNARSNLIDPNTPVYQDNTVAYTMTARTENIDVGTDKRKFWERIRVTYDRQGSASNLAVAWSDDDYANFSTARNVDMSTEQSWLTALGSSRRRAWRFTNAANTPCQIHAVEIDYRVGAA